MIGICDACRLSTKKQSSIDWEQREKQLWDLCDQFRSKDGSFDCICPGSGGKDSFYASHILKNKYGMHPLTVTWVFLTCIQIGVGRIFNHGYMLAMTITFLLLMGGFIDY